MKRILIVCLLVGCAHTTPAGSPEATLQAYLDAVAANRLDDAYALLSTDYRRDHDRAAFERALRADPGRRTARSVDRKHVQLRAEVDLADGDRLPLVLENGAWRLARDPLDFYPQGTPEDALRSFVRAVDHHRYETLLAFVPEKYRGAITVEKLRDQWEGERRADLQRQLGEVRSHLGDRLELSGEEARLPLGERKQARLLKESGGWKVLSLE